MISLFTLNPASLTTVVSFHEALQQTPIKSLVPDLTALGGALIMAGFPEGKDLGRDAERIAGGRASPEDEKSIRENLMEIIGGLSNRKWALVRQKWVEVNQKISTEGSPETLERRASLFSNHPAEAIGRFLSYPEASIAGHPLAGIVRANGGSRGLRVMLIVRSGAEENRGRAHHHRRQNRI